MSERVNSGSGRGATAIGGRRGMAILPSMCGPFFSIFRCVGRESQQCLEPLTTMRRAHVVGNVRKIGRQHQDDGLGRRQWESIGRSGNHSDWDAKTTLTCHETLYQHGGSGNSCVVANHVFRYRSLITHTQVYTPKIIV